MQATGDRLEFAPPPQPGLLRAFALAVLAHVLLVLALMHGLQWQRETQTAAVEAELWSTLPQQAAPKEVVQPPPPPPQPVVKPPQPVVKAPAPPEPPVRSEADIALEREKQKRELDKQRQAELEREQRRKELAAKKREEELARKKREEELAKQKLEQQKLAAEAKRKEDEKRRQEQEAREAQRLAKLREDNMRRMQAMAGTGAPSSTGAAAQSSGPSASWGARVQARVRPNIVFSDDFSGNPEAVIEVRLAPDGTIVGKRLKKSSGNRSWDEAVLRALEKTEVLPRDVDGRVPSGGDLVFRPKG